MEDYVVAQLEPARALLAKACNASDAKKIADMARAAEVYGRRQKLAEESVAYATAIRVDAMTLMGEFLKASEKNAGGGPGRGKTGIKREPVLSDPPTLASAGITKKESSDAQALVAIREKSPDLYEKVRQGKASISAARVEVKRQHKREELQHKASQVAVSQTKSTWSIVHGEVGGNDDPLDDIKPSTVRLVFADPPYNIGVDYGEGHDDSLSDADYLEWVQNWIERCVELLTADGSMWVLINDEYVAEFGVLLKKAGLLIRNWIIWYETFGVNCTNKFNRTKRHLFYCVMDPDDFVFHFDAVSRPSDRQTKYNDARANPAGKILDDVWFDIPRLPGTADERIPDFPTQLPLALLRRVVSCCTDPDDVVLDPFVGSATTGEVAIQLRRRFIGIERNTTYVELARKRLAAAEIDRD